MEHTRPSIQALRFCGPRESFSQVKAFNVFEMQWMNTPCDFRAPERIRNMRAPDSRIFWSMVVPSLSTNLPYNTLCALASAFTNQLAHYKTQFRNVVYLRLFVAFPGPELHCWNSDNSICLDDLLFEFLLMVVQQQVRLVRCNSREGCLTPFQRIELALKYFPRGGRELEE
ncbi:hypothetical protein L211DRAFT_97777 [Terfezia boudieri ATCC MYA-4762]|uniref:Uncharacterized protein n=1 Tax=Terfezia boudieri ATCC MYA-4762 TaxID=1051890 RepID=A0A3N4LYE5_9PEZI|nr:hypothetical protein L211DRAFT_97777 [Terfezia boudieri ATCC MYA-4762]